MTASARLDTTLLWDLPRVGSPSASRDGTVVVVPVTTSPEGTSVTVLWRVAADGELVAVTDDEVSSTHPAVSPDGSRIAFVRSVDGRGQVHVVDVEGGDPVGVTSLPLGVLGSPRWVDDARLLVVTTLWAPDPSPEATAAWRDRRDTGPSVHVTERRVNRVWDTWYDDDTTQHVVLVDLDADGAVTDLTPGDWLLPDPLADAGGRVAVDVDAGLVAWTTGAATGDDDGVVVPHLHVVPIEGGEVVDLTPDAPGPVGAPWFLPDGRVVVAISRERDFYAAPRDLWSVDPVTGERHRLHDDVDHGIGAVAVDARGRIVVAAAVRGRGRLLELADGAFGPLAEGHDESLAEPVVTTGSVLALSSSLLAPPEVVRVTAEGVTRVTDVARPLLAPVALGTVEERVVVGADTDEVQVLVLHPPPGTVTDEQPPPLVHLVHGGPHAAFGDEWHWRWNAARFAAEGWVVAMVNFHGSTGFGHAFTRSIQGDWATMPTVDVLRATDALVEDGVVDPDRSAIAGGSYGGYLVTWLCTTTDRFRAAVAHAAVTDLPGMWASDHTSGLPGAFGGRPWDDPATLARSPSSRLGDLGTPMLVVHGDRDLRVPIDQGRALYGALQDLGVASRLVVYPEENHWVLDRAASTHWYGEVIDWLHRHLDDPGDGG